MIPPIRFRTLPEQELIAYLREVEPSFTDDTARDLIERKREEWSRCWDAALRGRHTPRQAPAVRWVQAIIDAERHGLITTEQALALLRTH